MERRLPRPARIAPDSSSQKKHRTTKQARRKRKRDKSGERLLLPKTTNKKSTFKEFDIKRRHSARQLQETSRKNRELHSWNLSVFKNNSVLQRIVKEDYTFVASIGGKTSAPEKKKKNRAARIKKEYYKRTSGNQLTFSAGGSGGTLYPDNRRKAKKELEGKFFTTN